VFAKGFAGIELLTQFGFNNYSTKETAIFSNITQPTLNRDQLVQAVKNMAHDRMIMHERRHYST